MASDINTNPGLTRSITSIRETNLTRLCPSAGTLKVVLPMQREPEKITDLHAWNRLKLPA